MLPRVLVVADRHNVVAICAKLRCSPLTAMDRLQQKNSLLVKLGALFGPVQRLIEHADEYDEQEKAETVARYCAEFPKLTVEFEAFSKGQPGHVYAIQNQRFSVALYEVQQQACGRTFLRQRRL